MKKSSFLLTAIGASMILSSTASNTNPNITISAVETRVRSLIDYNLRVLSNGFGILKQDGHTYILMPSAANGYQPDMLPQFISDGNAIICNEANCIMLNISTIGIDLLV